MPLFASGAALGRLFGEILKSIISTNKSYYIVPGGWAVVGAASLVGSVTQAISTAVIMLEITGQIIYLLPILLSVLVSVGISKKISSLSIYDAISKEKGLPYLPDLQQ
jgi:chloride channel 2